MVTVRLWFVVWITVQETLHLHPIPEERADGV